MQSTYNQSDWWPVVSTLEAAVREGHNITTTHEICRRQLAKLYSNNSWWEPADKALLLVMKEGDIGQLATEAWRLTSALLEVYL